MRVHLIHADEELQDLDASSKLNAEWTFLSHLQQRGRGWAHHWLEANFGDLGVRSTFDLDALFVDSLRPMQRSNKSSANRSAE